jgi:hypothetical protein
LVGVNSFSQLFLILLNREPLTASQPWIQGTGGKRDRQALESTFFNFFAIDRNSFIVVVS